MTDVPGSRADVDRAAGMICEQVGCDTIEAVALLKARADALAQTIDTTARLVIEQIIRFDT